MKITKGAIALLKKTGRKISGHRNSAPPYPIPARREKLIDAILHKQEISKWGITGFDPGYRQNVHRNRFAVYEAVQKNKAARRAYPSPLQETVLNNRELPDKIGYAYP